ncbi:MAG TPA: competence protein TfoX [Candidatus Hydrogenedentes bacterium]|nr:competence protein TfoX [Candidatus Hydrogenedentota bacterium]
MAKTKSRQINELKNIGTKLTGRLNEIGVFSENDLRMMGAVEAHERIAKNHPNETLPVCYYLYSFEGALRDKHWNDIGDKRKHSLKSGVETV